MQIFLIATKIVFAQTSALSAFYDRPLFGAMTTISRHESQDMHAHSAHHHAKANTKLRCSLAPQETTQCAANNCATDRASHRAPD
jgi:hypothetical protein